jgi:aspartyl-tRNA(Asn)/glutamyl-tRNA(Gln) amidotransferase subunit B
MGELSRLLNESGESASAVRFTPKQLKALLAAVESDTISGAAAKEVFAEMFKTGAEPADVIAAKGLAQSQDTGALDAAIDTVMAANPKNVESYRAGNAKLLGFFVGQVMKALGGKANPKKVNEALVKKLGGA